MIWVVLVPMLLVAAVGVALPLLRPALTDAARPPQAMTRLQARFPHTVSLRFAPPTGAGEARRTGVAGRSDHDIALAFVREVRGTIVPTGEGRAALHRLPIAALPIDGDALVFFGRLGVLTVGDLARIDRAQLASRLEGLLDRGPRPSVLNACEMISAFEKLFSLQSMPIGSV